MRILSVVFSFLMAASLAAVALIYLEHRIGQHCIYVQDDGLFSSDQPAYYSYGHLGNTNPDTARSGSADSARHSP
jgi:hypothetical protein